MRRFTSLLVLLATLLPLSGAVASASTMPPNCLPSHITITWGQSVRGYGVTSEFHVVIFTNTGSACSLWGVPAVQPEIVTGSKITPVGPSAHNLSMGMYPAMQMLNKGQSVSSTIGIARVTSDAACAPVTTNTMAVSLGAFTATKQLPLVTRVCRARPSVTTRLVTKGTKG